MKLKKTECKTEIIFIAVDARPLTNQISGVSRVIFEILNNIKEYKKLHFILFANNKCHSDFKALLGKKHISWVNSRGLLSRKGGIYYNLVLPFIIKFKFNHINIFWGSQQVIPPFLPLHLKIVLTYYDLVLYFFPESMRWLARLQQIAVQRISVNKADYILSISTQTKNDMIHKFNYPIAKSGVSLLGFDKSTWDTRNLKNMNQQTGFDLDNNFILAVSTLEPRKNYSTLIRAWINYYDNSINPLPLVIVGKRGWEKKSFYDWLDTLLENEHYKIYLFENLDDSNLAVLYARCSFFCMASLYEGFGLPLLEALSWNKTAIVSDLPCFHEIGKNHARYIPSLNVSQWTQAIADLSYCFRYKSKIHQNLKSYYKKYNIENPKKFKSANWSWKKTASIHSGVFQKIV